MEINKIVDRVALLSYSNLSGYFIIHTDASKKRLGGLVIKNGNLIVFYLCKLNRTKINRTTT